jgi:hypothetical protein
MKFTASDLEKRKALWTAFSDLWLDTEISQMTLNYIVREMKASGYSLAKLKYIYQHEVAPVVYQNLLIVAGEWAGFDEAWLYDKIQQNLSKPKIWRNFRFFISRPGMFYATKEHWATLEKLFIGEKK